MAIAREPCNGDVHANIPALLTPYHVVPMAVCTHVLTLTMTVLLSYCRCSVCTVFESHRGHHTHHTPHMANIGQEEPSIRNMQVVSSNRVHSTHSCEANKCRIFKLFFLFIR